jgi:predicted component of type VI protein secretion system
LGILLEIETGPAAGKKLPVVTGHTVLIGRAADRAQFAVPHDNHMSAVHFAVECGPSGCRVIDKKSTNGTFLNGGRIQEAMLVSGDEIKAGETIFAVRIVPDDQLPATSSSAHAAVPALGAAAREAHVPEPAPATPSQGSSTPAPRPAQPPTPKPAQPSVVPPGRPGHPPALVIGSWSFSEIPAGWQAQEGLGIQLDTKDDKAFPSNIGAMEEPLGLGITLSQYVEAQIKMFREYLREPKIDAAPPPKIPGSSETIALEVRYNTNDGSSVYYHRVYVRSGATIGVLTLTTLEKDLSSVHPAYDSFLSGVSFLTKN